MDKFEKFMLTLAVCLGVLIVAFGLVAILYYLQLIISQIDLIANLLGYRDLIPIDFLLAVFTVSFCILLFAFFVVYSLHFIREKRRLKRELHSSNV